MYIIMYKYKAFSIVCKLFSFPVCQRTFSSSPTRNSHFEPFAVISSLYFHFEPSAVISSLYSHFKPSAVISSAVEKSLLQPSARSGAGGREILDVFECHVTYCHTFSLIEKSLGAGCIDSSMCCIYIWSIELNI